MGVVVVVLVVVVVKLLSDMELVVLLLHEDRTERTKKMDRIKTFKNKEFGTVRTIVKDGEPWFVGKDVAEILGYTKARNAIARHVDDDDKNDAPFQGVLGGKQTMTIINESGLYSLILGSKLPKAKTFKRWVTSEVLPTIYYI